MKEQSEEPTLHRIELRDLPRDTVELARFLIGKIIVHDRREGRLSGRIVETEAYPPGDQAAHHFRGPTRRNRSLFLRRGHTYVYFTYGNHYMLNISSEENGVGGGVLIRALEPRDGIELMREYRKTRDLLQLTRGPGRLAAALRIEMAHDGRDLFKRGPLWLGEVAAREGSARVLIGRSRRIGIARAAHRLLRFFERGNPFVSGPKRLARSRSARVQDSHKNSGPRSGARKEIRKA